MIYKGQSLDVKSGDSVLFRNEFIWDEPMTYLSAAVRFFTKCFYNHCAIIIKDWDIPFINESNAKGVITRPMQEHIERTKTKIIILRPKFAFDEKEFCIRANSLLGTKYGFSDLLFYQLLYRVTGIWKGRTEQAAINDGMVCSEYVAWCYNLPNWWLYSSGELLNSGLFDIVYQEK
jgi:hypothetical protein